MAKFDLSAEVRQFAGEITNLLNQTVCDGIRVTPVDSGGGIFKVGYGIRVDDIACNPIPLRLGKGRPKGYIGVLFSLRADSEREFVAVQSSVMTWGLREDTSLLHYDFERDKIHGYPEAHLQVVAQPKKWARTCEKLKLRDREFSRLHLPVGGRRFRPSMEDLVEFLVVEKLADGRPDWEEHVTKGRELWERRQFGAAIRANPAMAREVLGGLKEES